MEKEGSEDVIFFESNDRLAHHIFGTISAGGGGGGGGGGK